VSALRAAQNATLLLPTELIYTILAISIGDYFGDMILLPSEILKWDAIMTFLHVSRTFRGCIIKLLYHLWGETFIHERTRYCTVTFSTPLCSMACSPADRIHSVIKNYKPTLNIFRQLSRQAHSMPHSFTCSDAPPKHLSARVVRHPICPLARIWSGLIRINATANALLEDVEVDWTSVDLEEAYTEKDLKVIMTSYAEIPSGIRPLLQGRIIHSVGMQAAFWTKREEFPPTCAVLPVLSSTHNHPQFFFTFYSEKAQSDCPLCTPHFAATRRTGTDGTD